MNDEQLKELAAKVVAGKASQEESLTFMQGLNSLLEELKVELKK